jgi:hypothetical protein
MMAVASRLGQRTRSSRQQMRLPTLGSEQLSSGRIYVSLVKGELTWPDPSELAQSDTAMKELWVESAQMVDLPEQA